VLEGNRAQIELSFLLGHDMALPFQAALVYLPFRNQYARTSVAATEWCDDWLTHWRAQRHASCGGER
jgi:hypothetical protein